MARKRVSPDARNAEELQTWLEGLGLNNRVLNPLRRELEVVQGKREAGEVIGAGTVLGGMGRKEFAAELYRDGGGRLTELPNVGASAITALRAVIPAPASTNGARASGDDEEPRAAPAEAAPEAAEVAPAASRRRGKGARGQDTPEAIADPEPAPEAPAPRRRGRPRREEAAPAMAAAEVLASPEAPKRRGRRRADEAAAEAPDAAPKPSRRPRSGTAGGDIPRAPQRAGQRAEQGAAQQAELRAPQRADQRAPAPAEAAPAPTQPPDPSFAGFLKLWRELHPQGQRAAMQYMVTLLTNT